ncbi:tRNA preQ1(34) S-adenosylmethionine ribosyltransferase-isomerase QueA [Synergistaceae bacterium OttesenSCG-928-D05]|nr:tRNA preQ1(34) S-adenosylmethionine ribosyltransferase-isomerase QueA [Synergistaceae bacterium OttesenSCG-928-D05]
MHKNETDLGRTSAYDYDLPKEQIAQNPVEPRDASRLLVIDKKTGEREHKHFRNIIDYLNAGDLLVLNDTRVLPARLYGKKKGRETQVEIFVLRPTSEGGREWIGLVRPGKKLPEGTLVTLDGGTDLQIGGRLEDGLRTIHFPEDTDPFDVIHRVGETPLPHYITESTADPERYQTVYAKLEKENSVAAPTAGLHFTQELLAMLEAKGVQRAYVTLHVGLGTFRPVKSENIAEHIMHSELCEVPEETARKIAETKKNDGRVVAVGTTVVRTLESFAKEYGEIKPGVLDTRLFISPGFEFKIIDALVTNFHLPKSTLLMLVSAFGGYDLIMKTYREAVTENYRFFSFGDSMLIH